VGNRCHERFGTTLIDRTPFTCVRSSGFSINDHGSLYRGLPQLHSWLETILLADRNARPRRESFNDEYYDRLFTIKPAILIRQLSDAAKDVPALSGSRRGKRR